MESTLPLFEVVQLRWERASAPRAQSKFTGGAWHLQPTGISPHTCKNKERKTLGLPGLLASWVAGIDGRSCGPWGPHGSRAQGGDQISCSTMKCTPLCIRMSLATAQLLPFSRQQLALLRALTDHSGTGGRCSVPDVAGGVQVALLDWSASPPDQAGLVSTAQEPDHPTMDCTVRCSWPGRASASSWQDLQSQSK